MRQRLTVLAVAIVMGGCSTQRAPVEDKVAIGLLGFLQPGGPTRAEIEARLGPPPHTYERGQVVTYALEERDGRLSATIYSARPGYTLVLEYAADGRLLRRAMVERP